MTTRLRAPSLASAAAALLLAACGGGSDPVPRAALDVPAAARASVQAFTRFVAARPADDLAEPLGLEGLQPPTSETALPSEVG